MTRREQKARLPFVTIASIGVFLGFLGYGNASAAESPLEVVRTTTHDVLSVLQDPAYQNEAQHRERNKKMWEAILSSFDFREIAKRSLGVHWDQLNTDQKSHFVDLFVELIKGNYTHTIERYAKNAQFHYAQERLEGKFAEVETWVDNLAGHEPLSIAYRLHQEGEQWLIYDVVAEHVSLVRNYRTQFDRIIQDSSYAGLLQALEKKIDEIKAHPPA